MKKVKIQFNTKCTFSQYLEVSDDTYDILMKADGADLNSLHPEYDIITEIIDFTDILDMDDYENVSIEKS